MAYPVANPFRKAIRGQIGRTYTVDAWFNGVPVAGAQGLEPLGGTITDTNKPGVRRVLQSLQLEGDTAMFERLSPLGTQLKVFAHLTYPDRDTVTVPMGVFVIDEVRHAVGDGLISITAPDKWELIRRARFIGPANSVPGTAITDQIASLITGALPGESVAITATSSASVGNLTWDEDREKAILDMAASVAAWAYFDRDGAAVVADIPTRSANADWLIDASLTGSGGVLLDLDLQRSARETVNVVVVTSSAADGEKFPVQVAFDSNPSSPTYAGTDPFTAPGTAGPFGIRVKYIDTPTDTDAAGALAAAQAELNRSIGLASQVNLVQVPNPAVDAFDVIDVQPPSPPLPRVVSTTGGSGFGTGPFGTAPFGEGEGGYPVVEWISEARVERHVVDTVTHPLTVEDQGQPIEARKVIVV